MSIFCRHDWEVKHRETLPSPFEQMAVVGLKSIERTTLSMFDKTSITILACKKCGCINKTVVQT